MRPFTKKKRTPQKPSLFSQEIIRCFLEIDVVSVAGLAMVIGFFYKVMSYSSLPALQHQM